MKSSAQCGEITQDFSTSAGGFTGDFTYSNQALEKSYPRNINVTQTAHVFSPYYNNVSPNGSAVVGFTLSGYTRGASYQVNIYNSAGTIIATTAVTPVNSNPNANNPVTVCRTIIDADLFQGIPIKYEIIFTLPDPSGNGGSDVTVTFDDFSIGNIQGAPLPVRFASFDAKTFGSSVLLNWKVGVEENLSGYEIQKSTDGINFTKIGFVNASSLSSYSFTDPSQTSGSSFYRIKTVDINTNKYQFSTILNIKNGKLSVVLKAFPSPARNEVTVQHGTIANGKLSITTADGRQVKLVNISVETLQTTIDISSLHAGLYLIRVLNDNGSSEALRVIKQ